MIPRKSRLWPFRE